ncbi:uncharacterized protein TRIADDRAFT_54628 [Trichoplax adhaerens]|uniref:Enoyl reductase (ER) domain-containing protein n=1 Tax=Trichoplax adhaerens TaxID=10228 RepID=B3RSK2_TRIAD|nr:hypothetical protein TRIADDRAFT_54628 [Trichoplax adhaerens]EDV26525.1 hypothetical protein TRIADDRAFT_54628 [Trichoplax adhaerens]|eukprot:XP_002110521.1 hypothetical protein TRIADDRAFT_54628 [Trichoplax adhaerens]
MNTAIQLYERSLTAINTPIPRIVKEDDVVICVSHSGLSKMDVRVIRGDIKITKPVIAGRQLSGTVYACGSNVQHIKLGDRVVVNPRSPPKYMDRYCWRNQSHMSEECSIYNDIGIAKNGGWSEYCRISANQVYLLPPEVPENVAPLCDSLSSVIHTWNKLDNVPCDARILVCGAGMSGLLWISYLHFRGFREIVVCEPVEIRRRVAAALDLGYEVVHPTKLDIYGRDDKLAFDVLIDTSGDGDAIQDALVTLRKGGKLIIFNYGLVNTEIKINPYNIVAKELTIIGSSGNPLTFAQAVAVARDMANSYLNVEKLGIRVYKLRDYNLALTSLLRMEITQAIFSVSHFVI